MKYIPLNLIPNNSSKYVNEDTLVYNVVNSYRLSKVEVAKNLLYYYPELKIKDIKILRYGKKIVGSRVSPKTKVIIKVRNKNIVL